MGTEQERQVDQYLEVMAVDFIGPELARHACMATPAAIISALKVAGIDIIVSRVLLPSDEVAQPEVPHETPARRYSVRVNPQAVVDGGMVTRSFRLPKSVSFLFDERIAELKADPDEHGIENQTDALQDAIVKWLLMEGK